MNRLRFLLILLFQLGCAIAYAQSMPSPWRSNDATLVSLCLDGLGKDAPEKLAAIEVSDIGFGTRVFELVGHTTTGRPMYEGALVHPLRFRAVLIDLPGGGGAVRFDRPESLQNAIEGWRYSDSENQCTPDSFVAANAVLAGAAMPLKSCPDLGIKISYRVDNGPGYGSRRILERQKGLSVLNGLRGCRDLIYK